MSANDRRRPWDLILIRNLLIPELPFRLHGKVVLKFARQAKLISWGKFTKLVAMIDFTQLLGACVIDSMHECFN